MKKEITLIDYFANNKERYLNLEIKNIIENIQIDILKDYPEMIKPESTTLIMVESLENALESLNFNWLENINSKKELVYFHNNEPIDNLNLFFELNQKYLTGLSEDKFKVVKVIIESWQNFISEILRNTGSFQNKLLNTNREILFLKTIDSKEWLNSPELFVTKKFGDKSSNISINFIYKEGDPDFESNNLAAKILKFKTRQLLK